MNELVMHFPASKVGCECTSDLPSVPSCNLNSHCLREQTLAEVLDSIGKDCTKQFQSYLEQCQTKQDGE